MQATSKSLNNFSGTLSAAQMYDQIVTQCKNATNNQASFYVPPQRDFLLEEVADTSGPGRMEAEPNLDAAEEFFASLALPKRGIKMDSAIVNATDIYLYYQYIYGDKVDIFNTDVTWAFPEPNLLRR